MPTPKQQHFVQRAYLDGFLLPGASQLVCYGRKGICFRKEPAELAMRRKYYSVKNEDGSWDDHQEELIERTIETPGLAVIQKLISGKTRLNWEDRRSLSLYIAFQEQRTPAAREQSRKMSGMLNDSILSTALAANPIQTSIGLGGKDGKVTTVTFEEMLSSHKELCDDHALPIHKMQIGATFQTRDLYQQMKWTLHHALGQARFVTTDTPVIRVYYGRQPGGTGLDRSDVQIRFPLSAKALMTITHDAPRTEALVKANESQRRKIFDTLPEVRVEHLTDAEVGFFNKGQVRHAQVWVFTSEECSWIPEILCEPCALPRLIDMSTRHMMHMRSEINYDPTIDLNLM